MPTIDWKDIILGCMNNGETLKDVCENLGFDYSVALSILNDEASDNVRYYHVKDI